MSMVTRDLGKNMLFYVCTLIILFNIPQKWKLYVCGKINNDSRRYILIIYGVTYFSRLWWKFTFINKTDILDLSYQYSVSYIDVVYTFHKDTHMLYWSEILFKWKFILKMMLFTAHPFWHLSTTKLSFYYSFAVEI